MNAETLANALLGLAFDIDDADDVTPLDGVSFMVTDLEGTEFTVEVRQVEG